MRDSAKQNRGNPNQIVILSKAKNLFLDSANHTKNAESWIATKMLRIFSQ
ncbi:hypothetical protein [Helicobacter sp. 23-1045]